MVSVGILFLIPQFFYEKSIGLELNLNKNLVYWHPDLIQPRNKVTYDGEFYVREYWGDKNNVSFALSEADVFVTYTNYETQPNIRKLKIDNFYIYFYEN